MFKTLSSNKDRACYILAFLIPVIFMLIIAMIFGFYPFGRLSVLVADMRYQFVDYYGYLKSVFFGNNDLFYSFSKTFGGDMMGFTAYYLGNPFVLMLLFFPNDALPAGILFMIILIIGLSGFTFNYFINNTCGLRWASLIYSTAYALMGYFVAYINCTLYFYNIMLLPLIVLGLFRIVKSKKISFLYIVSLFLSIISNYYMGYMACLFSIIVFVYLIVMEINNIKEIKNEKYVIFYYFVSSVIAVGMSAFSLFAVIFSLRGQKNTGIKEQAASLSRNFRMIDVFSGLYSTSFNGNISDGLPIIYCGVLTVVFLFFFFISRRIAKKEKIMALICLLAMLISFYIDLFNVIWHGMAHPIGFPYRNSYLFCFLLIFFSYKGFIHINEGIKLRYSLLLLFIYALYSLYMLLSHNAYVGLDQIIISGMIICLCLFLVYGFNYRKEYMIPVIVGLLLIQSADLIYNGYISIGKYFDNLEEDFESYSIDKYADFVDETSSIVSEINDQDPDFFRIEKMYRRTHNDAMLIGYNGLSHFSSCETSQVKNFMGNLGFRNTDLWSFYGESNTAFVDSLMGIKYLLSQYDETSKPFSLYMEKGEKYVYKNPYALPLMFGANSDIELVNYKEDKHFEFQNDIASGIIGEKIKIYRPIENENIVLENVINNENEYSKIDKDKEAYIEYNFTADSEDFVYMYFSAPEKQNTNIFINDLSKNNYFDDYGWSVREVGHYKEGEDVSIRMYLEQDTIKIDGHEIYYEDKNALNQWYEKVIKKSESNINKESSSHLISNIKIKDADRILFTVPYEKDWTIKVDGNKVDTKRVFDCLMAIEITPGDHTIEMRYVPRGFIVGLPMTILCFLFFIFIIIERYRNYKRNKNSLI